VHVGGAAGHRSLLPAASNDREYRRRASVRPDALAEILRAPEAGAREFRATCSSSSLAIDGVRSDRRSARGSDTAQAVSPRVSIYASVFRTTLQVHAFIYEHTAA